MESQILDLGFQDSTVTGEQVRGFINTWIVPTASVIVVFTALLALVRHVIRTEVSDMTTDIQTLKGDVKSIRTDIEKNSNKIDTGLSKTNDRIDTVLTKALERAFPAPQGSKGEIRRSLNEMRGILQFAEEQNLRLNPQLIATYGQQVLMLTNEPSISATAWETSLSLLNYRSSLNANLVPSFLDIKILNRSGGPHFEINFKPLSPPPAKYFPKNSVIFGYLLMTEGSIVSPEKAAIMERISRPITSGGNFEFYIFDGMAGTITLDDQRMKNVIVRNSVIEYNGGPVILENVYFVHCIFRMRYTPNGSHLGNELLASASTTFSISS